MFSSNSWEIQMEIDLPFFRRRLPRVSDQSRNSPRPLHTPTVQHTYTLYLKRSFSFSWNHTKPFIFISWFPCCVFAFVFFWLIFFFCQEIFFFTHRTVQGERGAKFIHTKSTAAYRKRHLTGVTQWKTVLRWLLTSTLVWGSTTSWFLQNKSVNS